MSALLGYNRLSRSIKAGIGGWKLKKINIKKINIKKKNIDAGDAGIRKIRDKNKY